MRSLTRQLRNTAKLLGFAGAITAGCARSGNTVITQPIGPEPVARTEGVRGELVVFTESNASPDPSQAIQEHGAGRLGFTVTDASTGVTVQTAPDGRDVPAAIALSPGFYRVKAETLSGGTVEATARIEPGRTTEIYLDGSRRLANGAQDVVRDSNGNFIGWRADVL